jgi:hypothetical protein
MPSKGKPDQHADALRRGWERISPDAPFAVDFSDPHNPIRPLNAAEKAAADDEQADADAGRKLRESDRAARAAAGISVAPAGAVTDTRA